MGKTIDIASIDKEIAALEAKKREAQKANLKPMKEDAQKLYEQLSILVKAIKVIDSFYTAPWEKRKTVRVDSAIQQHIELDSTSGVTEDEIVKAMEEKGYNKDKVTAALKNRLEKWWIKTAGKYYEKPKAIPAAKKTWTPPVKK